MNRRTGVLTALLLTALMLCAVPGLLHGQLNSTGRTDDRLKPASARTMVVWVTSWGAEDGKLISGLCTAFEKSQPGVRVYLRKAAPEELYAPDAVLPDVVLHRTGDILSPEAALLPLTPPEGYPETALYSGRSQGVQYALPLWYSPYLLSLPPDWQASVQTVADAPYFQLQTPAPTAMPPTLTADCLPWERIMESGKVYSEGGVGLLQLLNLCPAQFRQQLRSCQPVLEEMPAQQTVVCSLRTHLALGEDRQALALRPATGQQARYVSLCRENEDAIAFVQFLLDAKEAPMAVDLAPVAADGAEDGSLMSQLLALAKEGLYLPNAFALPEGEINSLCLKAFATGDDPVATLLRLR